jgi:hypothetical protein
MSSLVRLPCTFSKRLCSYFVCNGAHIRRDRPDHGHNNSRPSWWIDDAYARVGNLYWEMALYERTRKRIDCEHRSDKRRAIRLRAWDWRCHPDIRPWIDHTFRPGRSIAEVCVCLQRMVVKRAGRVPGREGRALRPANHQVIRRRAAQKPECRHELAALTGRGDRMCYRCLSAPPDNRMSTVNTVAGQATPSRALARL